MFFASQSVFASKSHIEKIQKIRSAKPHKEEENKLNPYIIDSDDYLGDIVRESELAEDHSKITKYHKEIEYREEIDTNVVCIQLSQINNRKNIATGDPIICKNCQAIFNKYSKYNYKEWVCEFCYHSNAISEPDYQPEFNEVIYYKLSAQQASTTYDYAPIIICIDISGSMCSGIKVSPELASQFINKSMQSQATVVQKQYVSRFECVLKSVEITLNNIIQKTPYKKVGIITFNNSVTVYGDGWNEPTIFGGKVLDDVDTLLTFGTLLQKNAITHSIKDSFEKIYSRLAKIEETGPTALGPALALAIGMCPKELSGSKVLVCTDGIANLGVGNIDKSQETAKAFYSKMGECALAKKAVVSIISIVSEDCKLEYLFSTCNKTAGTINKISPDHITISMANIINCEIIATNVNLSVMLHKLVKFRNEDDSNLSKDKSTLRYYIGNVTNEKQITFEYRLKSPLETKNEKIQYFPEKFLFQSQIEFTLPDKSKSVYVLTQELNISSDKEALFEKANYEVLQVNAIQQIKKRMQKDDIRGAQVANFLWDRKIKVKDGSTFKEDMKKLREDLAKNYFVNTEKLPGKASIDDDVIAGTAKIERDNGTIKFN